MPGNVKDEPRLWGGGRRYTQFDMDDLEVRKVRALERIADALDGGKTSKYSGNVIEGEKPQAKAKLGGLFDCFKI